MTKCLKTYTITKNNPSLALLQQDKCAVRCALMASGVIYASTKNGEIVTIKKHGDLKIVVQVKHKMFLQIGLTGSLRR